MRKLPRRAYLRQYEESVPMRTSDELLAALSSQSRVDRVIVELLAANYSTMTRTALAKSLVRLDILDHHGKRVTIRKLASILTGLASEGLIEYRGYARCSPVIREILARQLAAEGRYSEVASAIEVEKTAHGEWDSTVRAIRLALYENRADEFLELLEKADENLPYQSGKLLEFFDLIDEGWLKSLDVHIQLEVSRRQLDTSVQRFTSADAAFNLLESNIVKDKAKASNDQMKCLIEQLLFRGRLSDAAQLLKDGKHPAEAAWLKLIAGDLDASIVDFQSIPKPKEIKHREWLIPGVAGLFYTILLATSEVEHHRARARSFIRVAERDGHPFCSGYKALNEVIEFYKTGIKKKNDGIGFHYRHSDYGRDQNKTSILISAFVEHWSYTSLSSTTVEWLEQAVDTIEQSGYFWVAAEIAEILARDKKGNWRNRSMSLRKRIQGDSKPLADLMQVKAEWERKLHLLGRITALPAKGESNSEKRSTSDSRLVWYLCIYDGWLDIEPRHQILNKKGVWSKGRKVALKRLYRHDPELDFLTDHDRRICQTIDEEVSHSWSGYPDISYSFGGVDTFKALEGHPLLFRNPDDPTPVEVVFSEPRLIIDESKRRIRLSMYPKDARGDFTVVEDGPHRIEIFELTEAQRLVAKVLDGSAMVPLSARNKVEATVAALAPVITLQSDVAPTSEVRTGKRVAPDSKLHLQLTRQDEVLDVRARFLPLGSSGPSCLPGQGQRLVMSNIDGEWLQAERDLISEQEIFDLFISSCPTIKDIGDVRTWHFEDVESSLSFLLDLAKVEDLDLLVEWSDGEIFEVTTELDASSLDLDLKGVADGFSLGGKLKVDKGRSLPFGELLTLIEDSPARFIQQEDGRFLALTEAFRKQLRRLGRYSRKKGKKKPQILPLALPALESFFGEVSSLRVDKRWKDQVSKIKEAESAEFSPPSTLKADLRSYQMEGFRWLARLSAWGAGACLADDMGLGKTVQGLSIALDRAPQGPTLVVAPMSVCDVWLEQAAKFAPTLKAKRLGNGDRKMTVEGLGPFDILIVSYGLLDRELSLLKSIEWSMVILDEAQAIKNMRTKRFKAAVQLRGGFRLATTGTPIENRLEELWSIFSFVNPGLLGERKEFERRYATPIERDKDRRARADLRHLVLPFIMRRTKGEVLDELPPRTDIDMRLEMSPAESALYEALRQQALEELSEKASQGDATSMKVLAWIMKLRRMCCNPLLVDSNNAPESCKLTAFQELVGELLGSGHKALVFSQFVGHLSILREWLDGEKIGYQYLDGSTTARKRSQRISAFQSGEGDLFLISLRAGGLGLNLTAADSVIHMDPWWNPAVEDQASDRAHRIGQSRPVTVYRLITANTIEEKIVALHRHKRDIADQLLEGANVAGKITADELLALLRK